tara:strand:+ start:104 stop:487 length:384 start_codon:yes stop_codon:yes gene_type:complete
MISRTCNKKVDGSQILWYNIYISRGGKNGFLAADLLGRWIQAHNIGVSIMALKRQKNNIVNLALMVVTADEKAGVSIDQTILNGKSATVSVRLLNGGRKSAAIKLDRSAIVDLQEALTEILATEGDF